MIDRPACFSAGKKSERAIYVECSYYCTRLGVSSRPKFRLFLTEILLSPTTLTFTWVRLLVAIPLSNGSLLTSPLKEEDTDN